LSNGDGEQPGGHAEEQDGYNVAKPKTSDALASVDRAEPGDADDCPEHRRRSVPVVIGMSEVNREGEEGRSDGAVDHRVAP
jgi:hypothetical protein